MTGMRRLSAPKGHLELDVNVREVKRDGVRQDLELLRKITVAHTGGEWGADLRLLRHRHAGGHTE